LVYNQIALRPFPLTPFQSFHSLNIAEEKYSEGRLLESFSIAQKLSAPVLHISYPKKDTLMSFSNSERHQAMNINSEEKSSAKYCKSLSNCFTARQKFYK